MSRSFKKNAILKDGSSYRRKYSHHITRTKVRQIFTSNLEYDEMLFPTAKSRELINQYDICDWKWFFDPHPHIWISSWNGKRHVDKPSAKNIRAYHNK